MHFPTMCSSSKGWSLGKTTAARPGAGGWALRVYDHGLCITPQAALSNRNSTHWGALPWSMLDNLLVWAPILALQILQVQSQCWESQGLELPTRRILIPVQMTGFKGAQPSVTCSNLFSFPWLVLTHYPSKAPHLGTAALRYILVEKLLKYLAFKFLPKAHTWEGVVDIGPFKAWGDSCNCS